MHAFKSQQLLAKQAINFREKLKKTHNRISIIAYRKTLRRRRRRINKKKGTTHVETKQEVKNQKKQNSSYMWPPIKPFL